MNQPLAQLLPATSVAAATGSRALAPASLQGAQGLDRAGFAGTSNTPATPGEKTFAALLGEIKLAKTGSESLPIRSEGGKVLPLASLAADADRALQSESVLTELSDSVSSEAPLTLPVSLPDISIALKASSPKTSSTIPALLPQAEQAVNIAATTATTPAAAIDSRSPQAAVSSQLTTAAQLVANPLLADSAKTNNPATSLTGQKQPVPVMPESPVVRASSTTLPGADAVPQDIDILSTDKLQRMLSDQALRMNSEASGIAKVLPQLSASSPLPVTPGHISAQNSLSLPEPAPATTYQGSISQSFGHSDWNTGMGKQVLMLVNQNIRSAELKLHPANLGPIEVRVDVNDDEVSIALSSRHAAVRDAMEMALPRLREMFEENGMHLADADISQQSFAEQRSQHTGSQASPHAEQNEPVYIESRMSSDDATAISTRLVDYYI